MSEKFTLFWSEEPFSQWSPIGFFIEGQYYNTAEQWMMSCKAKHFKDNETLEKIMKAVHPKYQKAFGREVKNFDKEEWSKVARDYVYNGNIEKFHQNSAAKEQLFATVGTTLVEASPKDEIWGIGLSADNPDALNRSKWKGRNWLGEVLTKVRDDLLAGGRVNGNPNWE